MASILKKIKDNAAKFGSVGAGIRVTAGQAMGDLMRKTTNQGTTDTWKPDSQGMVNFSIPGLSANAAKTQSAKKTTAPASGKTSTPASASASKAATPVRAKTSSKAKAPVKASSVSVAPSLTKEQQLQIDTDNMGLKGIARQAFIEEKRGLLPKISSTKKYNAVAEAEKSSGITTSTPVDAGATDVTSELATRANELKNEIANAQVAAASDNVGNFELPSADEYKKLYDLQQAGADKEFQVALENLKAKYETAAENERQQASVNAGKLGQFLGRAGAFGSASGQTLITNTEMANRQRQTELAQQEALAVKEAQLAKDQNDLTRMESYLTKADEIRQERNAIKEKNIDLGFEIDDRAKEEATTQASYYGNLTADQFKETDPAVIDKLEKSLGMPTGYLKSINDTQQALTDAKSDAEKMEVSMKLFDLAKELPDGQTYKFSDGTEITGFNEPEGKVMEMITADGGVAFVTIDPATGEILKTVEVPGMMSELKANAMFKATGRGNGSGGGAVPDAWDADDVQLAAIMRENIGKSTGEVVDMLNMLMPEGGKIELDERNRNTVFTPSAAVGIGALASTSFSADPSELLKMVEGDYTFREITVDGKKTTVAINNNNASNYTAIAQPSESKASGGGIGGFFKNLFAGSGSVE